MNVQDFSGRSTPLIKAIAALLFGAALGACGGGGGGGDFSPPAAESPPPTSQPAPAAPPEPLPPASPARDPYGPVAGSEPAPSLSAPQAGSTAAVGMNGEGIYEDFWGYTFVSPNGDIARKQLVGTLWGSIATTGLNWTFNPGTAEYFIDALPVTGSGTFSPMISMDGSYAVDGGSPKAFGPVNYSTANALAVRQESVKGKWANTESSSIRVSIDVDENGVFTGSTSGSQIGVCGVSGSVKLAAAGTAKNMYVVAATAVNTAGAGQKACALETGAPYVGPAAIVFSPAGNFVGNGYFRAIYLIARHPTRATITIGLRRQ